MPTTSTRTSTTRQPEHASNQQDNPFFVSTTSSHSDSQNPFLGGGVMAGASAPTPLSVQPSLLPSMGQLALPNSVQQTSINPFFASRPVARSSSQPPSYASVVSGEMGTAAHAQGVRQSTFVPVPTFITHGPSSVPVSQEGYENFNIGPTENVNQFVGAPSPLPSNLSASTLFGQPKLQIPANVGHPHFAPHFESRALQAPPTAPPPSYNQGFVLQVAGGGSVGPSQQSGAGTLPSNTTLHVKGVPDELNNDAFMEKHFSRFGPLKSVVCHPQKKYATVSFQNKVKQAWYSDVYHNSCYSLFLSLSLSLSPFSLLSHRSRQ